MTAEPWFSALGLADYVALDVETTGLDPTNDALIEVAAVRFFDGVEQAHFTTLLAFDGELPAFITELTGIHSSELVGQPRFGDVAEALRAFIGESPLVGQNVEFDLGFLRSHAADLRSRELREFFDFAEHYVLDTAMLSRVLWPEWSSFGLASLCSRFGVKLSRAHRALDDARATGEVLAALVNGTRARIWPEFAQILHRLTDGTSHRATRFFKALPVLAEGCSAPDKNDGETSHGDPVTEIDSSLDELFGGAGVFSRTLSGYAVRPSQIEMAQCIEEAIECKSILVIEAPTGVGKSLAYLTPAIKWVSQEPSARRQIVVSSHTKALQEQLDRKDAKLLSQALDQEFSTAVLKGRNNYLCLRRLNVLLKEAPERLSDIDRINILPLIRWALLTTSGDVNEIGGFRPSQMPYLWSQVASDSVACAGSSCGAAKGDFYREALDRAGKASIVFVNHALLMTDPARFLTAQGRERTLVIDEAHQLENAVVSALTTELSIAAFRDVLMRVVEERGSKGVLVRLGRKLAANSDDLWTTVEGIRKLYPLVRNAFGGLTDSLLRLSETQRRSSKIRLRNGQPALRIVREHLEPVAEQWQRLQAGLSRLERLASEQTGEGKPPTELIAELSSTGQRVAELGDALTEIISSEDSESAVSWVEFGRGRNANWCTLYRSPIDIAPYMSKSFWPNCERAILTSATLSVDGRIDYFKTIAGLSDLARDVSSHSVSSPFRLEQQMRSFVPSYLPDPRTPEYAVALNGLALALIKSEQRGTLVLCTSNESVEQISELIKPELRRQDRLLLVQSGSSSVHELVAQFRRAGNAVLIGAATLWEGIDVVGDALQMVLITKIPFDVPSEPWVEARSEHCQRQGKDAFRDYSIPVAAVRLKQGIGRLIRHTSDRGVAIVADPRLFSARYSSTLRRTLEPPLQSMNSLDKLISEVRDFFAKEPL